MTAQEIAIYDRLKMMPPLSHWPNRPATFRLENSQVVAHIRRVAQCDLKAAERLFERSRNKRVLLYDHARLTWVGNRMWTPIGRKKRRKEPVSVPS